MTITAFPTPAPDPSQNSDTFEDAVSAHVAHYPTFVPEMNAAITDINNKTSAANSICIAVSDETSVITTGVAKVTFRMPYPMTLTGVRASLNTASSVGTPTFDINEGGISILSTKLTIDATEKTSTTAAVAAVLSDTSLADDAEMTIDIDVAGTGAIGAKIYLLGNRT